ncbi:MAG: lipoate--protein ligase family protein [Gloeobacterales cyanobacterium]
MASSWLLWPYVEADGQTHMALDRELLARHLTGELPPMVRFYRWQPAAISVGYHQKDDFAIGPPLGLEVVRRPTGGRAVLHQGDLTYMVICSGLQGTVEHTYQQLSAFLIKGMARLGVPIEFGSQGRGYIGKTSCFGTATRGDLVWQGQKLIGSAQLRRGRGILQHGSILLNPDRSLMEQVFGTVDPVIGLHEIQPVPIETICEALIAALEECFEVSVSPYDARSH